MSGPTGWEGLKGIVFDLDDTLYLQAGYKHSGFAAVGAYLEERGIAGKAPAVEALERIIKLHGPSHPGMFNLMAKELGIGQEVVPELVETLRGHRPLIAPFPGVEAVLELLKGKFRLGLLTDGLARVQRAKVAALGLAVHFDAVVFSNELSTEKPDEALFAWFEEKFGLPGEALLHVADNPAKDFIGARKRGWRTVRVLSGELKKNAPQAGYGADCSIEGAWLLPGLLESVGALQRPEGGGG